MNKTLLTISLALSAACSASFANCFDEHAAASNLPADLLRAIALVESGGNPKAVASNKSSKDLGLMQINSEWLSKLKLKESDLLENACLNIKVAADILKDNFSRFENPWEAVGAYNAGCSRLKGQACTEARQKYAWKVYKALSSLTPERIGKLNKAAS